MEDYFDMSPIKDSKSNSSKKKRKAKKAKNNKCDDFDKLEDEARRLVEVPPE